jgi:hypothetical protein
VNVTSRARHGSGIGPGAAAWRFASSFAPLALWLAAPAAASTDGLAPAGTDSPAAATALLAAPMRPGQSDTRFALVPSRRLQWDQESAPAPAPNPPPKNVSHYVLPALLSAVVPGTGEIVTGHWWNGLPLVAADVATWIGYAHYQNEGQDIRSDSYHFADRYWHESRWQDSLTVTSYYDTTAAYNCDCSPPWIPREQDEREYYENIGKYPQFYPGWDDWKTGYDPESPQSLRRQYVDMRIASNDSYDNADALLSVAAITRVVSVVQCIWLVHRDANRTKLSVEPMFGRLGPGLRLRARF